jgi:hypothetical protein
MKYFLTRGIDNYTKLCTIEVDLSHLPLRPKYSGGGPIYRLDYDIVLLFGLTELQAMLAWKENVGPSCHFIAFFFFFFYNVARALNDGVRQKFYTIQIPLPTAPNSVSTLCNFQPCDHIGPIHRSISYQV